MMKNENYSERLYRLETTAEGLFPFNVTYRESDLLVWAEKDLSALTLKELTRLYEELASFIKKHPRFQESLVPYGVPPEAPTIARDMAAASELFGIGPMAGVAGAFADHIGQYLGETSPEVLVENGGDLYVASNRERLVGIFAGNSPLSGKLALRLPPSPDGTGLCTSSATVGPSLSLGKADAAVVLAESAVLADAAATALGNAIRKPEDIQQALESVVSAPGIIGCLAILGENLGAAGALEICRTG